MIPDKMMMEVAKIEQECLLQSPKADDANSAFVENISEGSIIYYL
jgi:hypothetical protein